MQDYDGGNKNEGKKVGEKKRGNGTRNIWVMAKLRKEMMEWQEVRANSEKKDA